MIVNPKDTITVDVFIDAWKQELQEMPFNSFALNMKHLKIENKTYAEWIKTWLAWSELSSDEDIDSMYSYVYVEDE